MTTAAFTEVANIYQLAWDFLDALIENRAGAFLQRHPEILRARGSNHETVFHLLVVENRLQAVELLATLGAEVNTRNQAGFTPLADAVALGYVEMVELLLSLGADARCRGDFGESVLHRWISSPNARTLRALLNAGADPDARCDLQETPLLAAVSAHAMSDPELVQNLLPEGFDSQLLAAQRNLRAQLGEVGHQALVAVELLAQAGASLAAHIPGAESPLQRALNYGDRRMAELLRRLGATDEHCSRSADEHPR